MPKSIRVPTPIKLEPLTLVVQIDHVDVYVHWTVFAVAALILANAVQRPLLAIVGLVCYMGVLFIHEWGHVIAAHRRGSKVLSVKLYPIFGLTYFETPWTRFDHCVIAWGGVLAQLVVALPLVAWVAVFGYTRFEAINAVLAILGFISLAIALFNLLPFSPLDGATAWGIIPAAIQRVRLSRQPTRSGGRWNGRFRRWKQPGTPHKPSFALCGAFPA
jgi:Zn-dependent protease